MDIVNRLLSSEELSIRYKAQVQLCGQSEDSQAIIDLRNNIKQSPRVRTLLGDRDEEGRIRPIHHVYKKWKGAHWVLASLADIGYPEKDNELAPVVEQVFECWLNPDYAIKVECGSEMPPKKYRGVPYINGRARRCASQQGNALFATSRLGFVDDRSAQLAEFLMGWQWPDGGWNCDRKPEACNSSFWESLTPLRGLAEYSRRTGDAKVRNAVERTAELFLKRKLFRRVSNSEVMHPEFLTLHYPCYWYYDILFGLKVMAECGLITDPRCEEALDVTESKKLPDGGWAAEARFYRSLDKDVSGSERVNWGVVSKTKMNEWVTVDALYVLKAAGRL